MVGVSCIRHIIKGSLAHMKFIVTNCSTLGVPVAIVSVLVGLNDPNDFITKDACWCRGDGVLFWTFVGTIGLILLVSKRNFMHT